MLGVLICGGIGYLLVVVTCCYAYYVFCWLLLFGLLGVVVILLRLCFMFGY